MKKEYIKNILIGLLLILFVGAVFMIFCLSREKIETKDDKISALTGTVIVKKSTYLLLESEDNTYVVLNSKGDYLEGDKIEITFKDSELDKSRTPYQVKIIDEELILKKEEETNHNSNSDTNINNGNKQETSDNKSSNTNTTQNNSNNTITQNADTAVLSYVDDLKQEIDTKGIKSSIKSGFVTIIDFLFYNGKIKGYTFSELSDSAKLKVLSATLYFDSKIDSYFPGYKESISNNTNKIYTSAKTKIISAYLTLTTSICINNQELCTSAKANFQTLKTNFGLTWDLIKDIAGDGITNLKNWYEIWREN